MDKLLCAIYVFVVIRTALCVTSDEISLYTDLFDTSGYKPETRPVVNASTPVEVALSFSLISLGGLDELNQVLQTVGYVDCVWTDEHLTWNPSSYGGIEILIVPPKTVWLPDIVLEDSADSFYHETFTTDFRVEVQYEGKMRWEFGGPFVTNCDLDMSYYPFDSHTCSLDFQNWMYTGEMVQLTSDETDIDVDAVGTNGLWKITSTSVSLSNYTFANFPGVNYQKVSFDMELTRKPSFYIINLIMPCIFVVLIALVVYLLPVESGEKVSLGITVLLSFLVFLLVIIDSTPRNSDNSPILTTFVLSIMAMSALSVIMSILILYLHHHSTKKRPPRFVRIIFFRWIATIVLMRKYVPIVPNSEVENDDLQDVTKENVKKQKDMNIDNLEDANGFIRPKSRYVHKRQSQITNEPKIIASTDSQQLEKLIELLQNIIAKIDDKENEDAIFEEWAALARVIDRALFYLTVIYMIIILGYCFGTVS